MKVFFGSIFFAIFLFGCLPSNKTEDKKRENRNLLYALALGYLTTPADNYSKIFYLDPLFLSSRNYNLFPEASAINVKGSKKKLVILHGWQPTDRDNANNPDIQFLKERLIDRIWKDLINSEFLGVVLSREYDVYFYTYLTSASFSSNAKRFREKLDSLFSGSEKNLVLYAHSMGGLIAKSALYVGEEPRYIQKILAVGTPFHGSPWASPQFQTSKIVLGDLASFITDTEGGRQLAWDNFDNSLFGAINSELDELNKRTHLNGIIYAFYGNLDSDASGYQGNDPLLNPACTSLGGKFSPSDCIVPVSSATGQGLNLGKATAIGNFNHTDINLRLQSVRTTILQEIQ
jgi:pimeloyl-ACP methyl ester carboxylesterase